MDLSLPEDSVEREYLDYWAERLLDPADPQRARWLALEQQQIARNDGIAAVIAGYRDLAGCVSLDVGCQTGALPIALAKRGATVTGVDVSEPLIAGARLRARCHGAAAEFVVAEGERLPFDDARFDLVTFVDVIEHVADARATVRELARVLRPGGTLYLYGPNRLSPRLFVSDPHYRLAGVSVLPEALGRWYVTRVRGFPRYEVGVLPVASVVAGWLRAEGLQVRSSAVTEAERWWLARGGPAMGRGLVRAYGALRMNFAELFTLVAEKPSKR